MRALTMSGNPALTYTTNVILRCENFPELHDKGRGYRFIFIGPEGTWLTIVAVNGAAVRFTMGAFALRVDAVAVKITDAGGKV